MEMDKMNEQLQQALGRLLDGLDATVTFLSAEIPDVIHQLLLWYAVKYGLECLFGLALLVGWIVAIRWGFKKARAFEASLNMLASGEGKGYYLFGVAAFFLTLMMLVAVPAFINIQWLQILIAPKLWLIEYAAKLVK